MAPGVEARVRFPLHLQETWGAPGRRALGVPGRGPLTNTSQGRRGGKESLEKEGPCHQQRLGHNPVSKGPASPETHPFTHTLSPPAIPSQLPPGVRFQPGKRTERKSSAELRHLGPTLNQLPWSGSNSPPEEKPCVLPKHRWVAPGRCRDHPAPPLRLHGADGAATGARECASPHLRPTGGLRLATRALAHAPDPSREPACVPSWLPKRELSIKLPAPPRSFHLVLFSSCFR